MSAEKETTADAELLALLAGPPTERRAKQTEHIYWPNEGGYGGGSPCATPEQAAACVKSSIGMGYGVKEKGQNANLIHVTRITTETWVVPADLAVRLAEAKHGKR